MRLAEWGSRLYNETDIGIERFNELVTDISQSSPVDVR